MPASLQVLRGLNPGQQFPLEKERIILGRHPDCDIVLDAAAVSRQHAVLSLIDDRYRVEDMKSRNGTFVNGQAVQGFQVLEDGDRIRICDLVFSFHQGQQSPTQAGHTSLTNPSTKALMVDDEKGSRNSSVVSHVNMSSSRSGIRVRVNPEAKLKALLEITHNLGRVVVVEEVLNKILESLFKIFPQADRGIILLREGAGDALIPKATIQRRVKPGDEMIRVSKTIIKQAMDTKEAILSNNAGEDSRFSGSQSIVDMRIRSLMCAPLVTSEGESIGVIQIDTEDSRSIFSSDDLEVLASVASQAAIGVDNAKLHETLLKKQSLDQDLLLAHKVQQGFLPDTPPQIAGYSFFDFYRPANQVGGDYFDYISLPGNRLAVVVADVSGKGISAALIMAKLSAEMRYCLASEPSASEAINQLNTRFVSHGWRDRFVTLIMALIDLDKHTLTLVNAGHMPPYLRKTNGEVSPIGDDLAGVPLGILEDFQYNSLQLSLEKGECLTMFTDGISEAMNDKGELYGLDRLRKQLSSKAKDVGALSTRVLEDVRHFVGNNPQSDDICLICFGREDA